MTKDFLKQQGGEYLKGLIFRLLVNEPEGATSSDIQQALGLPSPPDAALEEMRQDGLVWVDGGVWKAT